MIGWLIAGGAALYLADKMGYLSGLNIGGGTTVQQTPADSPQANNPNTAQTNGTLTNMIQLMQQYNQDPMKQNYGAWVYNFYYKMLRGIDAPDPYTMFPNRPNLANETMPINDWWAAMTGNGFSGMGMIAHHVNPYVQGPRFDPRKMFGAGLNPTGIEQMMVYKGQS